MNPICPPSGAAAATAGAKIKSEDVMPSGDPLTDLALQFGGVALRLVRNNLGAEDALSLQAVNRPWCSILRDNEDELFKKYLQNDFPEGPMLADVVEDDENLTQKRMYLAFQRKFRLGKHAAIHWRHPHSSTLSVESQDVQSLLFIARIGKHCAKMKWGDLDHGLQRLQVKSPEELSGFSVKRHQIEGGGSIENPLDSLSLSPSSREMVELFRVSLHCIDLQKCKVMALMEDSPARLVEHLDPREGNDYQHEDGVIVSGFGISNCHGAHHGPEDEAFRSLYGFPTGRALSVDWHDLFFGDDKPEDVEWCAVSGVLELFPTEKNGDTFRVTRAEGLGYDGGMGFAEYLEIEFENMHRHAICNFFRAVMEEKCH